MIEGKLSNQPPKDLEYDKINGTLVTFCETCDKIIPVPTQSLISGLKRENSKIVPVFYIWTYLTETENKNDYYIYHSTNGKAVCYCSKYCRNKHNHRFTFTGLKCN